MQTSAAPLDLLWVFPLSFIIIITFMFNSLIIVTWFQNLTIQTPSNLLIVSLAVVDMLVASTTMPITLLKMTGNHQ